SIRGPRTAACNSFETKPTLKAGRPRKLFEGPYFESAHDIAVTPDGKGFILIRETETQTGPREIQVVFELAGKVEEEGEVEKRRYGVDCFGGRGVANLRSGLGRGQAATDGTTWLSDPTHHRSSSFEAPGLLIRKRDLATLREDPFNGGFWGILLQLDVQSLRSTNLA